MLDSQPTSRSFRFSLLTLVLLTTIVALGIAVAQLYWEVAPLRDEVKRLRAEVGELDITDKTKVHAVGVVTDNQLRWKWRVWVPEGANYVARGFGEDIPAQGYPDTGATITLSQPGEHVLEWGIEYDPRSERWEGRLKVRGSSAGSDPQPWVDWSSRSTSSSGVGTRTTRVYDAGERVELMRLRCTNDDNTPASPDDPVPGFLIWIEPQ
ncbi:hypothetical protein [Aeoliella mucimassa]|uniref:Uncharacterized protein n=1 Tax=Aeoliella mucimassa TaxID=2527972 RepID=A0A518AQZ6_9BACT|nr:hypothetical protein [Aeoliella mucimassa]QDU57147.1 hypothetical protein Pan181_33610 [Aeoliella mucimassa]